MPTKITDDVRILVALRDGLVARNFYKSGYGWSNPPEYWCCVEDAGDQPRYRIVSLSSIKRCVGAGLIEIDETRSARDGFGHDLKYKLTDAGASAAAALDVTLDRVLAEPKPRPPKPEMTSEEKEAAKRLRYARKDLSFLARGGRLVKNDRGGWAFYSMEKPYTPPGRNSYDVTADRNLPLFRHLTEEFTGVDGRPSLRINAAGAEIIAKRRPLTPNITAAS